MTSQDCLTAMHAGRLRSVFFRYGVGVLLTALFFVSGAPGRAGAEAPLHFKAGEWKIDAVMTMKSAAPGMPEMPPRESSLLKCLTSRHLVPDQKARMPKGCTMTRHLSGDTLTVSVRCEKSVTTGSYTYSGRSFSGQSVTTMKGLPMTMETRFKGHYIGPCRQSAR